PDLVLLDVHLPGGGGVEVLRRVLAQYPRIRFLALSVSDAAEDVIGIVRGGARGYVTKTISGKELANAIARVADGDAGFSPRLAGFVLDAFPPPDAHRSTPNWTASPSVNVRSCATSHVATPTRKWPRSCSSPSRPSKHTCPRCCASS